ncbi:hypothetical protein [uncultured Acidaminococcus sp.]|uniref:hypothetical protein n=1 Tax=uncultured Acidaminococcus sp. TaxID=352152 RepID=UPI00294325C2|nr:hypothetical protein [uncultured Acidaminococcus sp.]
MPYPVYHASNFFTDSIPNEIDLSKLKSNVPGFYQTAWHGSPYDFEHFDLGAMGSGEGNQVHGWGLYFAKNRKISEAYKSVFGYKGLSIDIDGKHYTQNEDGTFVVSDEEVEEGSPLDYALNQLIASKGDREAAIKELRDTANQRKNSENESVKAQNEAFLKAADLLEKAKNVNTITGGKLYEVNIPENSVLLDEQKKFSKMSKGVKGKIQKTIDTLPEAQKEEFLKELIPPTVRSEHEKKLIASASKFRRKLSFLDSIAEGNAEYISVYGTWLKKELGFSAEEVGQIENNDFSSGLVEKIKNARNQYAENTQAERDKLNEEIKELETARNNDTQKAREQWLSTMETEDNVSRTNDNSHYFHEYNGKRIYNALSTAVGSPRAASELLNSNGIKGITYVGADDGRCFVVFDDKAISIIDKYNQEQAQIQGQTTVTGDMISLFDAADQSTFMHESAHWYLINMQKLALNENASRQFAEDFMTLQQWFGNKKLDADISVEQHEKFARGFEAYLRTGKAPAPQLHGIFNRFKTWLTAIYRDFKQLGGKPTKEVTAVMDRMLATEDEISMAMKEQMVDDFKRAGGMKLMLDENARTWERWYQKVKEEAEAKVLEKAMKDLEAADQKDIAEAIEAKRNEIAEEMGQDQF